MDYYTETVKLNKMMQRTEGRKADYRVREHGTDRILAVAPTKEQAIEQAEAKLAAEQASTPAQPGTERSDAAEFGDAIEQYDREQYRADEWVREHDSIDDMDDYRPRLYTDATSEKLTDAQVRARRAARRNF